jgi:hypothetical protein
VASAPERRNDPEQSATPPTAQAFFRSVNEQIRGLAADHQLEDLELLCECADAGCHQYIEVPLTTYDTIRHFPDRFVVKRGHASADSARVVAETAEFDVVEPV